ncbi:MAG: recombinase family protein [Eubacteriales bacterium]
MDYHVVLYLRISSEDTNLHENNKQESNSIGNQRTLLLDFVKNDPELQQAKLTILEDDGYSGTNFDRPSIKVFQEMMERRQVNCLIVKDFSRFGRNHLVVSDYIDQIFPQYRVRFIAVNDGYDSINHVGRTIEMSIAFRQIINAYYSKDLSKKIKTSRRLKAQKGDYLSPYPPFGYVKSPENHNKLEIEPKSAEIVRLIFSLAEQGGSTTEIAHHLNLHEIPTCSTYKNEIEIYHPWPIIGDKASWDNHKVHKVLNDRRYLGCCVYGKQERVEIGKGKQRKVQKNKWILAENTHVPLITREVFDEIQKNITRSEIDQTVKHNHLFVSKIRCGVCSHALTRIPRKKVCYKCNQPKFNKTLSCCRTGVLEEELSDKIYHILYTYLLLVEDKLKEPKKKIKSAKNAESILQTSKIGLRKQEQSKIMLYEEFIEGRITPSEYHCKRDEIERNIIELTNLIQKKQETLDQEKENTRQEADANEKSLLVPFLKEETLTREMVDAFIHCIYVYPEKKIEIHWNFSDIMSN